MQTLLVFTGGGLAPALNPTIYGVVTEARRQGWRVLGGMHGWASLLPGGRQVDLTLLDIESLKDNGGTILRSSRANPYGLPDGPEYVKKTLRTLGIDAVIAIGGDDTIGAAAKLAAEGEQIVGIPKTIDNDLPGTYYTPGFPSAAYYLSSLVSETKRDAAYALSRIYVIEATGFRAGWLTCSGVLGGADLTLPPEWKLSWRHALELLKQRYVVNGNYAVVVVSQEARFDEPMERTLNVTTDHYGHLRHSFICLTLRDKIKTELGIDAIALYPGSFMQSGAPTALDRDYAILLGKEAVRCINESRVGHLVTIVPPDAKTTELRIGHTPLQEVAQEKHKLLPATMFDHETMLPTKIFFDYMAPLTKDFPLWTTDAHTQLIRKIQPH